MRTTFVDTRTTWRHRRGLMIMAAMSLAAFSVAAQSVQPVVIPAAWSTLDDQQWQALQNPDSSWSWGPTFADDNSDGYAAAGTGLLLLTGGSGLATIYLSFGLSTVYDSGLLAPDQSGLPNQGSASFVDTLTVSLLNKSYDFTLPVPPPSGMASTSGVLAFQIPFNKQVTLSYFADSYATIGQGDFSTALCGTPSPTNPVCHSGGYADITSALTFYSIGIPEGTQLAWNGAEPPVVMVPEPTSAVLSLAGLALLAGWRRRSTSRGFRPSPDGSHA